MKKLILKKTTCLIILLLVMEGMAERNLAQAFGLEAIWGEIQERPFEAEYAMNSFGMKLIFSSIIDLQDTRWYETETKRKNVLSLGGGEEDYDLLKYLTQPGAVDDFPGGILAFSDQSEWVVDDNLVNPWGNPYRVLIYDRPSSELKELFLSLDIPKGRNNSFVFIISDTGKGSTVVFSDNEEADNRRSGVEIPK